MQALRAYVPDDVEGVPARPPGEDELPSEDGIPVESYVHDVQAHLAKESASHLFAGKPGVFVATDLGLYYSELQAARREFLSPDLMVVFDTVVRARRSWVIWQEESAPSFVLELLSPSTEANDRGRKMQIYARAIRVPEYFLFDPDTAVLEGYTLDVGRLEYEPIPPLPNGRVPSQILGVHLGVQVGVHGGLTHPWLRMFRPDGTLILVDSEIAAQEAARADQEATRADQEATRADQEAARAAAMADELERLRARLRAAGID